MSFLKIIISIFLISNGVKAQNSLEQDPDFLNSVKSLEQDPDFLGSAKPLNQKLEATAKQQASNFVSIPHHWFFSIHQSNEDDGLDSLFWQPLGSFVLPGLGQYLNGNTQAGLLYSGVSIGGLSLAARAKKNIDDSEDLTNNDDIEDFSDDARKYIYGLQLYQQAGSMSLYHNFLTNLQSHQKAGRYQFLKNPDNPKDVYLAPFKFSFIKRHTTYIPLLMLAGLITISDSDYTSHSLNESDYLFTAGISYNAGTGEEAMFRGWMMPLLRQSFGSDRWSNFTTAAIFGALHISPDNPRPIPQFLFGYYAGWLTQKNAWSIQESIFIHAWWDVLAIGYALTQENKEAYLPLINASF